MPTSLVGLPLDVDHTIYVRLDRIDIRTLVELVEIDLLQSHFRDSYLDETTV